MVQGKGAGALLALAGWAALGARCLPPIAACIQLRLPHLVAIGLTCFNLPTEPRSCSIWSSRSNVPASMLICSWSLAAAAPAPPNSGCRALSPGLQSGAACGNDKPVNRACWPLQAARKCADTAAGTVLAVAGPPPTCWHIPTPQAQPHVCAA